MKRKKVVPDLHKKYILGSEPKKLVVSETVFLCLMTRKVSKVLGMDDDFAKTFISTRSLKHLYDKRTAAEYDFLIKYLYKVVKFPDKIYKNKSGDKRGKWLFYKTIKNIQLLVSVEEVNILEEPSQKEIKRFEVVTCFRVKEKYIKNCNLLWSWEDGESLHRNAFDANQG